MGSLLDDVCCACVPMSALAALAELRCAAGVEAAVAGERAWLRWRPGDDEVLRRVLPLAGVQLYRHDHGHWFRAGGHLPVFDVPEKLGYRPLYQELVPAPVAAATPHQLAQKPVHLTLAKDSRPRPTTAMRGHLLDVARWAEDMPRARLTAIRAAQCDVQVFLLGTSLPLLPSSERYWGDLLLVPLGCRPEPDLPEQAIRAALAVREDELLVLSVGRVEVIPQSAFQPLTRAGLRLACPEVRA